MAQTVKCTVFSSSVRVRVFESVCVSAVRFKEMGQRLIDGTYDEEDNMLFSCFAQRSNLTRKRKSKKKGVFFQTGNININVPECATALSCV